MAEQTPTAAVIELIERGRATEESVGGSTVVPNEVRINGQPVLVPSDTPITVHPVRPDELVRVTLTVFARRVSIRAEGDQP